MINILEKAKKIKLLICDVDGVLTNGCLYIDKTGGFSMRFHVHDGLGLKLLMYSGVEVAVISGSDLPIINDRMKQLGIRYYYKNQVNKIQAYQDLKHQLSLTDEQIAFIGDDLPDLPVLNRVGFSIIVPEAPEGMKSHNFWCTNKSGGSGAVREVCDLIMQAQDTKQAALERFLKSSDASNVYR